MLTINPSEVILTIINFFLLFFLLRHFLYKPIIKFMDERKKGIEEKMELEKKSRDELAHLDESMERSAAQTTADAGVLVAQERARLEERGKLLLQESREQVDANRKVAAASAAEAGEREKLHVNGHIDELAKLLADSLLKAESS